MSLCTGKEIHINYWMELPIYDDVVKRVEELEKKGKQPNFYQYPTFEWKSGILIMDYMCNRAVKRVPRGVICIGGLASEGVMVICSCRYIV